MAINQRILLRLTVAKIAELEAALTTATQSKPPEGKTAITNIYYDPDDAQVKYVT